MKEYNKFYLRHPNDISKESKSKAPGYIPEMEEVAKTNQGKIYIFSRPECYYIGLGWSWNEEWLIPTDKNGQLLLDFGE